MPASAPKTPAARPSGTSARAGLTLPAPRVAAFLKRNSGTKRTGASSAIFATAVLEYVASELLESAAKHAAAGKRKRVSVGDVCMAMRSDGDLARVAGGLSVASGGKPTRVAPHIAPAAPKPSKRKAIAK